jgi:beta-glucanase (GH16 family)
VLAALAALVAATLLRAVEDERQPAALAGTWTAAFDDDFSGSSLDEQNWSDSDPWQLGGWARDDAWFPQPHTAEQMSVQDGVLTMKSRRGEGLPEGASFTSAEINTAGGFVLEEGETSYVEARLKAPSAAGTLPGFWLLGDGTDDDGTGWPLLGEVDILEFANNPDEAGRPYFSVWFPRDVATDPPGTFLNGAHDTHPATFEPRPELQDSWHTWGLFRSADRLELFIDGSSVAVFRPGETYDSGIPLPDVLFTAPQHVRLSLFVGGDWAGAGREVEQYEEADLMVDWVRVWKPSSRQERVVQRLRELVLPG